jgi:hypothetical protein
MKQVFSNWEQSRGRLPWHSNVLRTEKVIHTESPMYGDSIDIENYKQMLTKFSQSKNTHLAACPVPQNLQFGCICALGGCLPNYIRKVYGGMGHAHRSARPLSKLGFLGGGGLDWWLGGGEEDGGG